MKKKTIMLSLSVQPFYNALHRVEIYAHILRLLIIQVICHFDNLTYYINIHCVIFKHDENEIRERLMNFGSANAKVLLKLNVFSLKRLSSKRLPSQFNTMADAQCNAMSMKTRSGSGKVCSLGKR